MSQHAFLLSRSDLNCTRARMLRKPVLHMPWLQADCDGLEYFPESEKQSRIYSVDQVKLSINTVFWGQTIIKNALDNHENCNEADGRHWALKCGEDIRLFSI